MITLLVIAVDRYFVITRPLASMGVMSRRRALYVMAAAWFYSMFWSLPPFFGWSESDGQTDRHADTNTRTGTHTHNTHSRIHTHTIVITLRV